jgi:hypothetical protein
MARNTAKLDHDLAELEAAVSAYETDNNGWKGLADEWGNDMQTWKGQVDGFGQRLMEWVHGVDDWGQAAQDRFMLILSRIKDLQDSDNVQNKRLRSLEKDVKLLTKRHGREEMRLWTLPLAAIFGAIALLVWSNIDFRQTVDGLQEPFVLKYADSGWTSIFVGALVGFIVYCLVPRKYVLDEVDTTAAAPADATTTPPPDQGEGNDAPTTPMGTPAVGTTENSEQPDRPLATTS